MLRISQGALRRLIRHTSFAAAADESRPFLTGVFIEVEGDEIRLVATDSSRLAFPQRQTPAGAQTAPIGHRTRKNPARS